MGHIQRMGGVAGAVSLTLLSSCAMTGSEILEETARVLVPDEIHVTHGYGEFQSNGIGAPYEDRTGAVKFVWRVLPLRMVLLEDTRKPSWGESDYATQLDRWKEEQARKSGAVTFTQDADGGLSVGLNAETISSLLGLLLLGGGGYAARRRFSSGAQASKDSE